MRPVSPPVADLNRKLLEAARQHIAQGNLQQAAQTLNQALRQMPDDARVFMLAAVMADKAGNHPKAEEAFERCLALAPMWGPGLLEYALYRARRNQFAPAVELAEKVARIEPRNPRVLSGVVDIANRAGHWAMAERHLRRGLELHPGDVVLRRYLADALDKQGEHAKAREIRDSLVAEDGDNPRHRIERVKARVAYGEPAQALADIEWLQAHHPDTSGLDYYAALARGQTPPQQPAQMAHTLFESMAANFDQHLVGNLGYRLPKIVADHLVQRWPDKQFNLLDLGCGTGLLGICLAPLQGYMIGVDLSLKMLEQAAKHNVYYRFHNVNLRDALRETPAGEYEAIACLDALPYLGDMQALLPDAARILKDGGVFVFSCEQASESGDDLVLSTATQRYAHKRSHVEALCRHHGLQPQTQELTIRYEGGEPVPGFWIAASKTGHSAAAPDDAGSGKAVVKKPRATKAGGGASSGKR